jgi:hypothetical protein
MPLVSKVISQELVVNFYCRETSGQGRVNVWKVQSAPSLNIRVGQTIWFQSNIFVMGRDIRKYKKAMREGQVAGKTRYEGEVLCIVGWQKHWVQFSVGNQGGEEFQLWVPVHWTALGVVLCAYHILQRGRLPDSIPSLPRVTRSAFTVGTQGHNNGKMWANFGYYRRVWAMSRSGNGQKYTYNIILVSVS